jgi:hypothetical protein
MSDESLFRAWSDEKMRAVRAEHAHHDLAERIKAALRMLTDSGDVTPQAKRIITQILEEQ